MTSYYSSPTRLLPLYQKIAVSSSKSKMASVARGRLGCSLSFSVRLFLQNYSRGLSTAAKHLEKDGMSKKELKRVNKEANMKVQVDYKEATRKVVSLFREERLENLRQREAAEGEQQKLLEREKVEEKRIIEGVKMENLKLADMRKERIEIEEWTRRFRDMRREARHIQHQERLREKRIAMVKQAIEESKDFITPENLEEKINYALDNETNYNFALKPNGERIYSTKPPGNVETDQPGPAAFGFTSS
ncbi:28S ribosomal protein S26, mitochondrial-like [Actinia tenebrosa]|uniref:Small ribosomal subunit protein mS26 n=1 Tax=Actinia tenebrosa TaxID=6105 RepID=A0A6P8HRV1_ACTTE|nr:28S ribosomal protein S26, mitochondrial-like [Actinia tenebrosa]